VKIKRLFLFFFLFFCASVFLSAQKVTLNFTHAKLEAVLSVITEKTAYTFAYSYPFIDIETIVSIHVKELDIEDALQELFSNTAIQFEIKGEKIFLSRREENPPPIEKRPYITVAGFVKDEDGIPLAYASVLENGTTNGAVTDARGYFVLNINSSSTITVSFIGYFEQQIEVRENRFFNITLKTNPQQLNEIVVTALGIEKKEKTLSYSISKLSNKELSEAKEMNFINSLAGKAAGVLINRNSSGIGASSRVVIRGERSISFDNQPLYVIDGIPILNTSSEQAATAIGGIADAGNRDGGDGISNINPEDISSISILKGASASALYGSQAANGVILITTKKGEEGKAKINFSSSMLFENAISLPEFQNSYEKSAGNNQSWGEKSGIPSYDHLEDYFQTGLTAFNSISISSGTARSRMYFSYANSTAKGIVGNNRLTRHNFNLRETVSYFDSRLLLDANVNFIFHRHENKPPSGGYYMNPLVGLYAFPRGMDMSVYKNNFEVFSASRNMFVQNWYTTIDDFEQNPYWLKNRIQGDEKKFRTIASLSLEFKVNDNFRLRARGNFDNMNEKFRQKIYASTSPGITGHNGRYIDYTYQTSLFYGDFLAFFDKQLNDFDFQFMLGTGVNQFIENSLRLDSKIASLYYPNIFTISNIRATSDAYIDEKIGETEHSQAVFGSAQVSYKDYLFLDITARNDWSSTLAFTKSSKKGFFYPSLGMSWLLDEAFSLPSWVSFGKLRTSWSYVGNALRPYVSRLDDKILAGGVLQSVHTAPFDDLKPEISSSLEVGTEWNFFGQRLHVDFSFYKTNTKNQLFILPSSAGAEYKYYFVNSGNIQNTGVEFLLNAVPVANRDFTWSSSLIYTQNKNIVLELHDELPLYIYGDEGFSSSYSMQLVQGGSFGDIYGKAFLRDEKGNILFENGLPLTTEGNEYVKVGNCNPNFMLSWANELRYKNFSLQLLVDGRFGGKVLSQTQAEIDKRGVSKTTGDVRDKGFVDLEGTKITNIEGFYKLVGGRSGITEYYMYDATNIRLREIIVGYKIPQRYLEKISFISNVDFMITARNVCFFYKKAPFDPDAVLSTANNNQGIDVFGLPMASSFGFNLKVSF
jgi:TonB-linked SusC/RagA family outer membrane protein